MDLKEMERKRMDTGQLLQSRDMWWAVVKKVMDLRGFTECGGQVS
jgi:hypothetical protein